MQTTKDQMRRKVKEAVLIAAKVQLLGGKDDPKLPALEESWRRLRDEIMQLAVQLVAEGEI